MISCGVAVSSRAESSLSCSNCPGSGSLGVNGGRSNFGGSGRTVAAGGGGGADEAIGRVGMTELVINGFLSTPNLGLKPVREVVESVEVARIIFMLLSKVKFRQPLTSVSTETVRILQLVPAIPASAAQEYAVGIPVSPLLPSCLTTQ